MSLRICEKDRIFTEAYTCYYPVVSGTIYTKVNNYDLTEDLTQEVFIRFYNKIDEIENQRRWLLGTLRFVVLEHFKKKSHTTVNIDDVFEDVNLTYTNGFRDTRIIITSVIEDDNMYKNETERILFDLIAVKNYSYVEVKRELGLSLHQVKYAYKKICRKIGDSLKQKGIDHIEELL